MNNKFKKLSLFRRLAMPLPELEAYYREKRDHDKDKEIKHIIARKFFGHILLLILASRNKLLHKKMILIKDERIHNKKPKLYCMTHIGGEDFINCYLGFKDPSYILWGDYGEYYKNFDGLMFWLNGVVLVDTHDRNDKRIALSTAIKILKKNGNILMAPEGTWNITQDKPVMYLYNGAAEIAIESGADIIPIAVEQYGNTYYVNIGRNISGEGYTLENKKELTAVLRDALATLKWEIIEKYGQMKRSDVPENAFELWMENFRKICDEIKWPMEILLRCIYVDKKDAEMREVQSILDNLIPSKANAFLFSKRNHD